MIAFKNNYITNFETAFDSQIVNERFEIFSLEILCK
jgi:hypothetical protein